MDNFKNVKRKTVVYISEILSKTEGETVSVIIFPLFLQLTIISASIIFPSIYGVLSILIMTFIMLAGFIVFALYIGFTEKEIRERLFIVLVMEFFLTLSYILSVSGIIFTVRNHESFIGMSIIGFILSGCLTIFLLKSSSIQGIKESLPNRKPLIDILSEKNSRVGDVVICKNKEAFTSGKENPEEIIPYKDRFLHMLILGATGTGKTSQMILPMLSQDIKNKEAGIIVMEPKGDLAQQTKFLAEHYGRKCLYFDPAMDDCPYFNPLAGREIDVVEDMATTFRMLMPDSATYFLDLSEQLVRYSVKVLKRLDKACGCEGKYANLITLSNLIQNSGGKGRTLIGNFQRIKAPTDTESSENNEIASWFLTEYFVEKSKVFENTSGVRSQVAKICSNEFLREVLNPDISKGEKNDIDFDKALAEGWVICISTAQGVLRNLSKFLGYFLILQLQSSVFRRPGDENTRRPCFLYIDEFQTYSTPGFSDMLTQGRSYRVACILATQARAQMKMGGGKDGEAFVNLVSANARNVVLFPGLSKDDAEYYSKQFGEHDKLDVSVTKTRKVFAPLSGGMSLPGHASEGIREQMVKETNISPTDIIYRPFGEITYSIIQNSTLQNAKFGVVNFINREIKEGIDIKIQKYLAEHTKKTNEEMADESINALREQLTESGFYSDDFDTDENQDSEDSGNKNGNDFKGQDDDDFIPDDEEKDNIYGNIYGRQ